MELGSGQRYRGSVVWFNNAKGYGFLKREGAADEVFVHYSAVEMTGYKSLKEGQAVEFEVVEGKSGKPEAQRVVVLEKAGCTA